jgi:putative endopeptidase
MRRTGVAFFTIALAGASLWLAANDGILSRPAVAAGPAVKKTVFGTWGVDLTALDRQAKPGDDFFRFAGGSWFDKVVIPADRPSTGSFLDLEIQSEEKIRAILADLDARKDRLNANESRVRDLFYSYVDTDRIEQLGLKPAEKDLNTIAALKTREDVARIMGTVPLGSASIFGTRVGIDDKNPNAYAVFLRQSGLGLPDRDYYLANEKGLVAARAAYGPYISRIFSLAGIADGDKKADAIVKLETEIARIHWTRAERRDAEKVYNPMSVAELQKFAPEFPWRVYLSEEGIKTGENDSRRVIVEEKSAFPQLAALFAATPVEVWRDYLTFHWLSDHATDLPKTFDDSRFDFYGKVLAGQKEQLARDKRGIRFIGGELGEAVGELYVARYFPPEAKAKAKDLVSNLLSVYRQRIETADWMSPDTRKKALEKLATFTVKIGYPDKWRDYSRFEVTADDLLGNQSRGRVFEWNRRLARLDGPVDRGEWGMSPQTVNAYYDNSLNEIVFPAAILQPPFFDPNADDAVNYGGIGAVIGHEISHGFDDQGSKYDATGELRNWWQPDDRKNFDARTAALVKQYGTYSPVPGMFVNGQLTLGENIADLAGLTVTQAAYHLSLKGKEAPVLDGFTGDQRLFLSYAQVWRYKSREETARQRVLSDSHSPPEFRVNGVVRNLDAWYAAWKINPENKLYLAPDARVHLW